MNRKIKDAFNCVTAEKDLMQHTEDAVILYMRTQNEKPPIVKNSRKRNIGLALAFVFVFAFSSLFVYLQPVSAVSINSTSSVEVYFNRFNRVVEVISYDENGEPTSEEMAIQNKGFEEVMDEILSDADAEDVYVTVASRNEAATREMVANLTTHQEMMRNMHIYQSSEEIMKKARENEMSMGRMHAMHELQESGEEYNTTDIETESTQELMEAFDRHHQEMMRGGHMHRPGGGMNGGHMNRSR